MSLRHQNRCRSLFASLCLVAIALVYAPLGGAAWALYSAACCKLGSQCPVHGHHHTQTPASSEHTMDCGHEMAGMAECSMSCCNHPDRPAVAPVIFVLPAPATVSLAANFEPWIAPSGPQRSVFSLEPLSPPPRASALAA